MRPLEWKKSVSFEKLLNGVAMGIRDVDTLTSLAGRLARLERGSKPGTGNESDWVSGGLPLKDMVHALLDAVDPDVQIEYAIQNLADRTCPYL